MSYDHPADHNLHDLHKAMQYNGAGQPEIRVTGGAGGGTSSSVGITNWPAIQTVDGTVDIGSIPEVEIKNDIGNPISISGNITVDNFPVTTTVTGTIDIGTMPGVEIINDISNPIPINYIPGIGANKPFYLEIAQGVIAGYSHNHKFGAVPTLSNNTVGSIWDVSDTLYPFDALGAGGVVNIKRNNGTDNGITVTVQGLDPDFNFVEEDIVISGPDNLGSTLFTRVNRAFITGTGITTNAGNIDIEAGVAGGTIVARISAGYGQTLMAVYTVPANKTMYLLNLTSTASDDSDATVLLMKKEIGSDIFRIMSTFELQQRGGGYEHSFNIPLSVVEKTDIDMRAITRSNNKRITGTFDMILVDN